VGGCEDWIIDPVIEGALSSPYSVSSGDPVPSSPMIHVDHLLFAQPL